MTDNPRGVPRGFPRSGDWETEPGKFSRLYSQYETLIKQRNQDRQVLIDRVEKDFMMSARELAMTSKQTPESSEETSETLNGQLAAVTAELKKMGLAFLWDHTLDLKNCTPDAKNEIENFTSSQ